MIKPALAMILSIAVPSAGTDGIWPCEQQRRVRRARRTAAPTIGVTYSEKLILMAHTTRFLEAIDQQ
jgi:hypothetical protein